MKRVIVTGGGGFVGNAIVQSLLKKGVTCTVIGRGNYPALVKQGVECLQGDIADREFIIKNVKNADAVFHVAAKAGIWGDWQHYYRTNVVGTKNIVDSCLHNKIKVLVHTSTPSVVFNGEDIENGREDMPYPSKFLCNYAKTKAAAEKIVLSVNQSALRTCAIRPHLIWGPGDPHLIPRLIERGTLGKLKIVGNGENLVDISYIDNVAHAHLLACQNLLDSGSSCGKAYFIGQERPVNVWQWINELFEKINVHPVEKKVPFTLAYSIGTFLELWYSVLALSKEPVMTRFVAEQLAKSHYFCHDRAKQDFNYRPIVSIEDGMKNLIDSLKKNDLSV